MRYSLQYTSVHCVTGCFLFRLQLALFNTSFRHVICAHTPRRAMLQERSERCSHKKEEEGILFEKKAKKHILEQWPALLLQLMKPNPSTHSNMVWGRASHECYPKVMARSSQGHSKVKSSENG